MLKALLIDDELFALKELQFHLENIKNINIVGTFTNPFEAFFNIKVLEPDVIFLDIDMPEVSGIYLAEQIVNTYKKSNIVFVTAYDQYAIPAFELHALDYILKPYSSDRIKMCISRLENKNVNNSKISLISENYEESIKKFFVLDGEDRVLINLEDICYIEALNKEVQIRTEKMFYSSKHPLKYYENKVKNQNFFRVHRSYIINLDKIIRISPKMNYAFDVHFKGIKDSVPISRTNVKTLKQLLEL